MITLTTNYLGLTLKNPIVASSSPLCEDLSAIRRMEDAGAAAVILPSLFEEQITRESMHLHHHLDAHEHGHAEALDYFPDMSHYNMGPDRYLEHLRAAREAVDIPIIGSLNGATPGGWTAFARCMEEAGASALELNTYDVVTDISRSGADVENDLELLVARVRKAIDIPLAVKLSPYFSSLPHIAALLSGAGADGLVLFNRFYQPDLDIENLAIKPSLDLSLPTELRARLRWVAILYGQIDADLAVTGGVHSGHDVLKSVMAGAKVAMTTSALLRHGVDWLKKMREELLMWMEDHEYSCLEEMRGSLSRVNAEGPEFLERANYLKVLSRYSQ